MPRPVRNLLIFLTAITAFRMVYIGLFDLIPDEAYYWAWSLKMDWCYYDQPAGIAAVNWLFTHIFGATTWGVRMGAVVLGLMGTGFVFLTAKRLGFNDTEASWSAVGMHILPLFAAGHVLILHDTAMMAAITFTLYCFTRAIFENRRLFWVLAGFGFAAAMYAKFSAVILAVGIVLFLVLSKRQRHWFADPGPYMGGAVAIACFSPVIFWNANNEWIAMLAVRKLAHRSGQTIADRGLNLLDFIGSQLGLVTPILLVMMVLAAIYVFKNRRDEKNESSFFLACMFVGVIGYFLIQSIKAKVQGNWTALAYLPGLLLVVRHVYLKIEQGALVWRKWFYAGMIMAAVATGVMFIQPLFKIIPLPDGKDMTDQVYGWNELAQRIEEERRSDPDLILVSRTYQIVSELQFYCEGHPDVYSLNYVRRGNQYDIWNDWHALVGKSVLFVDTKPIHRKFLAHFTDSKKLDDFIRKRNDQPVKTLYLTRMDGFHLEGPMKDYFDAPLMWWVNKMQKELAE